MSANIGDLFDPWSSVFGADGRDLVFRVVDALLSFAAISFDRLAIYSTRSTCGFLTPLQAELVKIASKRVGKLGTLPDDREQRAFSTVD